VKPSLLFLLLLGFTQGIGAASCFDTAMTTASMADCAEKDRRDTDKDLNRVYKQLMKRHETDTLFKSKLKKAQRAWLAFRDQDLELANVGGSVATMCMRNRLAQLNTERTAYLKSLLEATEGDVCAP
jgi:uncharacterized protein YecT (DUF1311 family)